MATPITVLLTTSGTGSRLGELTKTKNKVLVEVNGKASVTYIIDGYPPETHFVVTLGYYGDQVKEGLLKLYPNHRFTFVTVDRYEGPGSSLGYSMLQAESVCQEPFVFHACDTLITDPVPAPTENWAAGFRLDDATQYRTLNVQGDQVVSINDKGATQFHYIHIGLVGIHDYASFWKEMRALYDADPNDQALNDTFAINRMLASGSRFRFVSVSAWYDTGNPEALARTSAALGQESAAA